MIVETFSISPNVLVDEFDKIRLDALQYSGNVIEESDFDSWVFLTRDNWERFIFITDDV